MSSRTIAVERSTYERLKAARRDGESFTEVIDRLLTGRQPRLSELAKLFDRGTSREIRDSFHMLRREEIAFEEAKIRRGRRSRGHDL